MEIQQVTSLPQAINKAFTVTWYLLEPILRNLIPCPPVPWSSSSPRPCVPPPLLISQCKQRNNLQKNDTRQTVSCWHHSDLGIILPLWNAEQACRLLVQFWKEVGDPKAKQDALQWNALKKTEYFNQYLNFLSVGEHLLISSLTTETSTKNTALIYIDIKKSHASLQIKRPWPFSYHVFAVLFFLDCRSQSCYRARQTVLPGLYR